MEEKNQILQRLLKEGYWSDEDRKWFLDYLDNNDTSALQKLMQQQFTKDLTSGADIKDITARRILELIHQKIKKDTKPAKVIRLSVWKKVAAAAVTIFLLGIGTYFLFYGKEKKEIAKTENKNIPNDIMPGGNKATLTLANGSTIVLNNVQNGTISQQGNTKIMKLSNGQLAYNSLNEKPTEVLYNTITTPRGGQYQLTLSDGTKVWLNAASSLRYPASFTTGNERKVELTGEAYFEVVHNSRMPFIVQNGDVMVKDLGTHFNVNAYDDENSLNVTLLEGSVSVAARSNQQHRVIEPGEQAQVNKNGNIGVANSVDLNEVMAWKNGIFSFKGANIESIMREVSRWYDVDVIYEKPVTEKFYAQVSRNTSVSTLLQMLEATKAVHFKIEGKTISVMP